MKCYYAFYFELLYIENKKIDLCPDRKADNKKPYIQHLSNYLVIHLNSLRKIPFMLEIITNGNAKTIKVFR